MTNPVLAKSTSNGRFYVHPRRQSEVPSITNVIGMKDKPALKYWAAKQTAIFAAQNVEVIAGLADEAARIDLIKGAPFRGTEGSAHRGDIVHDWIDLYAKGKVQGVADLPGWNEADWQARSMWKQFIAFTKRYEPEWIMSEFTVWSDKHAYAGTGDWCAKIRGRVVFADTKTGNNVYPEVGLQLAAVTHADYVIAPNGDEKPIPKWDKCAVLHVRPRFTRLHPLNGIEGCFKAFLGLRDVFEWHVAESENVIGVARKVEAA